MKRNKVFLFIFPILLSSCSSSIEKINHEMQIYIASDLHLYSSNLIGENNVKYTKDKITSDGRVQEFDYELVKEFVKNININKPDYVFLTGDLSYNGEKDSHVELIKLLDIEDKIITIDAIGTQEDICNLITSKEKKGNYILKVKNNQKDLKDDITTYFNLGLKRDDIDIAIWETDYEKDHGRIEEREYYLTYNILMFLLYLCRQLNLQGFLCKNLLYFLHKLVVFLFL